MAGQIQGIEWHDLKVPPEELRPNLTLSMGQCFNWNKLCDGLWVGTVGGRALAIQQTAETTLFASLTPLESGGVASLEVELRDYFQLSHGLEECYTAWAAADPRMKIVLSHLPGVRVVRQCPWECLVSFICSSNNNIKRIALMLDRIRSTYGEYRCSVVGSAETGWRVVHDMPIKAVVGKSGASSSSSSTPLVATPAKKRKGGEVGDAVKGEGDGEETEEEEGGEEEQLGPSPAATGKPLHFFSFPGAQTLAAVSEEDLRGLGTGYRAKFIKNSAATLEELGGLPWLLALRKGRPQVPAAVPEVLPELEAEAAAEGEGEAAKKPKKSPKGGRAKAKPVLCDRLWVQDQLQRFPGVGRKVADCVAVFSLDQAEAVPVDTHVWAIAVRDYNTGLKEHQSLTPSVYELIGDEFRNRFTLAGWAHSVLFAAELPEFRRLLPELLQDEMKAFAEQRGQDKRDKREALSAKKAEKAEKASSGAGSGSGSGKKKAKLVID